MGALEALAKTVWAASRRLPGLDITIKLTDDCVHTRFRILDADQKASFSLEAAEASPDPVAFMELEIMPWVDALAEFAERRALE